ncbi:MAG: WG repeat-containing protein [Bacteroidia bacterium]|nr:WG repeat-containing protein [Bacteroidia bacterium]
MNLQVKSLSVLLLFLTVQTTLFAQNFRSFKADNGKWGFKDEQGNIVLPAKYLDANDFKEGLALVSAKKYLYGYIDQSGKIIIPMMYTSCGNFENGMARVKYDGKAGFIDKTGKEVIPCIYEEINNFREDLAGARLNGKWGFIDKSGKEVVPFKYESVGYFAEGLAYAELNSKYGFIDKTGKEIIPFSFDDARGFSDGVAGVRKGGYMDGKWGYIDKKGTLIIPFKFEEAGDFSGGAASVKLNGNRLYIDISGRDEKMRKQDELAAAQAEKARLAKEASLNRRDTLSREVFVIYNRNINKFVGIVNALTQYMDRSFVVNNSGEFNRSQWPSISMELRNNYCKTTQEAITAFRTELNQVKEAKGKNELYDFLINQLNTVERYVNSCKSWADYISTMGGDNQEIKEQIKVIDKPYQEILKQDNALDALVAIYKKRNSL